MPMRPRIVPRSNSNGVALCQNHHGQRSGLPTQTVQFRFIVRNQSVLAFRRANNDTVCLSVFIYFRATFASCNGYIPKRPRFDNPTAHAPDGAEPGYFPSGPRPSFVPEDSDTSGSRVVTNDPRSPKEVTEDSFGFDNSAGFEKNDVVSEQKPVSSERPRSSQIGEDEKLESARNNLQAWLAESDITDFDEFLRRTLKAGASTQLHGQSTNLAQRASSSLFHAIASVLTIVLHKVISNT